MTASPTPSPLTPAATKELIAQYATRDHFNQAVKQLLGAGFERTDLSVLASHDSLEVAGGIGGYETSAGETAEDNISLSKGVGAALESQLPWLAPFAIAGAVLAASGPVGIAAAAIGGAAAGAVALRSVFDELMGDVHADRFTQAVSDGQILLWVRTATPERVGVAEQILSDAGALEVTRLDRIRLETL